MLLSVGERLGPYEILAPIGAGGMGEVYKARDTRLDRIVAIKVSKEQFSERFEREARAVAALNHPHICQIYDVGPDYLVMEYIDGQPLKGPMALNQALKYAAQICEALETAHRKGIVHRDLKPSNIMVTKAGVKLLDFGLARLADGSGDSTLTLPGEVMGTPAYMAPEQWEGQRGDARADIYAFGCVLYEVLTGKRAAADRSPVEPPAINAVLRTCLEKDPDERWQSARDLRRALALPILDRGPGGHATAWRERTAWILAAALAVGLTVALFFGARPSPAPSLGALSRWTIFPPAETTFAGSVAAITVPVPQFALAPDGRSLVFAAARTQAKPMLWLRPLDEIDARPLAGTEDAQNPFWSSDGLWIGFFAEGKLKKIPVAGGLVQELAVAQDPRGGAWNRDDTILFGHGSSGLSRVSAAGGDVTPATVVDSARKEGYHRWPQFLPDGMHFLYITQSVLDSERGVYAGSLGGKVKKLLLHANSTAFYTSGVLLFQDGNTLQGQPFDPDRLELTGRPFLIADRVARSTSQQGGFSASSNGVLAYTGNILRPSRLTWFDRHGSASESIPPEGDYTDFRLSPDERRLAVSLVDSGTGNPDIWIADLLRGGRQRLTNSPNIHSHVAWSPDGSRIVFRANPSGIIELFQRGTSGGGGEQLVLSAEAADAAGIGSINAAATDWSSDGKTLLLSGSGGGGSTGTDLWLLPVGGGKPVRFLDSPGDQMHGNFSPDGRLIAYTSSESGKFEVNVETVPQSDKKSQVSTNGGYEPRWRADGRELYYLSEDRKLMAVSVGSGPSFGAPQALFQTRVVAGINSLRTHYVPSRDGQRFLINTQIADAAPVPITVVLNWQAGLKR